MTPYISIVIVARNDNYGGDFLYRISTFARAIGRQAEKYPGLFELVVVEWNPPPDRERLSEALRWPPQLDLRIITIQKEAHDVVAKDSRMPLFEYIGKNTGLRRARGEFILVTNPDIIFTDELMAELAKRQLKQDAFYRTDRYDFDGTGIDQVGAEHLVDFASSRVKFAQVRHDIDRMLPIAVQVPSNTDMMHLPKSNAFPNDLVYADGSIIECRNDDTAIWGLHTNASGDFLLASRQAWLRCRGYWERLDTFTHLDGYAVCRMKSLGLEQVLFCRPLCIFHIDHARSEQAGRPVRPYAEVHAELLQMRTNPDSLEYARQTGWGLAEFALPEFERRAA